MGKPETKMPPSTTSKKSSQGPKSDKGVRLAKGFLLGRVAEQLVEFATLRGMEMFKKCVKDRLSIQIAEESSQIVDIKVTLNNRDLRPILLIDDYLRKARNNKVVRPVGRLVNTIALAIEKGTGAVVRSYRPSAKESSESSKKKKTATVAKKEKSLGEASGPSQPAASQAPLPASHGGEEDIEMSEVDTKPSKEQEKPEAELTPAKAGDSDEEDHAATEDSDEGSDSDDDEEEEEEEEDESEDGDDDDEGEDKEAEDPKHPTKKTPNSESDSDSEDERSILSHATKGKPKGASLASKKRSR